MIKEANDFFSANADPAYWNSRPQEVRDAINITYFNNGPEAIKRSMKEKTANGEPYEPRPGAGASGGETFLQNITDIRSALNDPQAQLNKEPLINYIELYNKYWNWAGLLDLLPFKPLISQYDTRRCHPSEKVGSLFTTSQVTQPRRDPLTLDLDNDGLETVGIDPNNPILFDHDGDGVKTATGWIKPDDGFLVLDRNGNGTIDSGAELFGDSTPLMDADGNVVGKAEDGFAALAQEDTNGDGLVDANDARFADLRVWRDMNNDGISQADELLSLEQAGIAAIHVAKTENTQPLPNGNQLADLGSFVRTDGSSGGMGNVTAQMGDIDLAENTFYSQFSDTIPLTDEAALLPAMNGSGRVRSLQESVSLSPALAALLTQYAAETTRSGQLALLDQMIIEWGKTSDLAVTGEGAYGGVPTTVAIAGQSIGSAGYDAWMTRLQTLERFNGRPFGTPAANAESVSINLFNERLFFLNQAWDITGPQYKINLDDGGNLYYVPRILGLTTGSTEYNAWVARMQTLERFNGRPFAVPADGADKWKLAA